jgi:hypothetical protein
VKRCEEGREGIGGMASCTPQCRYLTKHIVRGYRRRKSRKLPKQRMQGNVKERARACSGEKMRKKNGTEYAVATWEQNRRQGMLYQGDPRHMDAENM